MAAAMVGVVGDVTNGPPVLYLGSLPGWTHSGPSLPSSMRCQAVGLVLAEFTGREAAVL